MNIIIGRLILFVNTSLKYDINYEIAMFIIKCYPNIERLNIKVLIEECFISRASITRFCELFGFHSWHDFHNELIKSKTVKFNQIKAGYTLEHQAIYRNHLFDMCQHNEDVFQSINHTIVEIANEISKAERTFLFGAIYPLSICLEFQNNMMNIGKKVYMDYHSLEDVTIELNENDMAIVLSATGRYIRECSKKFHQIYFSKSKKVLLTLSDQFETLDQIDFYLKLPQTEQFFDYNFYIMCFFELVFCEIFLNK